MSDQDLIEDLRRAILRRLSFRQSRSCTINEAIDRLMRARTLIGGDKCLVVSLVGSELEDITLDVVRSGESKYVEIAVRHRAFN